VLNNRFSGIIYWNSHRETCVCFCVRACLFLSAFIFLFFLFNVTYLCLCVCVFGLVLVFLFRARMLLVSWRLCCFLHSRVMCLVGGFSCIYAESSPSFSFHIYCSGNGSGLWICSRLLFGAPLAFLLPTSSYKHVCQLFVTRFFMPKFFMGKFIWLV